MYIMLFDVSEYILTLIQEMYITVVVVVVANVVVVYCKLFAFFIFYLEETQPSSTTLDTCHSAVKCLHVYSTKCLHLVSNGR